MTSHACMTTESIGSNLVESIIYDSRSDDKVDVISTPRFIAQADSIVETCLNQGQHRSQRVLLRGPIKSGKSCLAMDLAVSLALSEPCRCCSIGADLVSFSYENPDATCRNCTAVTLIVPGVVNRPFPIPCESIRKENQFPGGDSAIKSHVYHESAEVKRMKKPFVSTDSEFCSAMKRVKIVHVSSLKDIYKYLLTVSSLPIQDQPFGGILIDDIDCFFANMEPVDSTIRMSQLGKFVATYLVAV
jgi:hypothetical protein